MSMLNVETTVNIVSSQNPVKCSLEREDVVTTRVKKSKRGNMVKKCNKLQVMNVWITWLTTDADETN